ncbi:hypothetical protein REPUB_Repub07fG0107000 [Reevesia pubescens]
MSGFCKLWKFKIPSNVQCFLWLVILKKLPTKIFSRNMGVPLQDDQVLCPWCKEVDEDINHVLFSCSWTYLFWCSFLSWWGIKAVFLPP